MNNTSRKIFTDYVRGESDRPFIVSPFLPHYPVLESVMKELKIDATGDFVADEIAISKELNYQPMFMTDLTGLIFKWEVDEAESTPGVTVSKIHTKKGDWVRKDIKSDIKWSNEEGCPVKSEEDHHMIVAVCDEISGKENEIREYFRNWRKRVGDDGVIVIGHPHPSWLAYQINPQDIFVHWMDYEDAFRESMDAILKASLFVMDIAVKEGIDFMSDSSYGLEMTSPQLFEEMDAPYIKAFADWTHEHNSLFWYHNCGITRKFIMNGDFNRLGCDVYETVSPPPAGDNDLAESRKYLDKSICSKGNLDLVLLRDGKAEDVIQATRNIVHAVKGYKHIVSTADAVLTGTPPENFIGHIRAANEEIAKL
jgi:uroporphyrinogen-III decarboxylase